MENKMKISGSNLTDIINKCAVENGSASPEYDYDIDWKGLTIHVTHFLTLQDMVDFVNGVTAGCFAKSDNSYMPEVRDFFFRCNIVAQYTNIELPDDLEEKNQLIYGTDLIDTVLAYVDRAQFHAIIDAIDKKVKYLVDVNVKHINDEAELVYEQMKSLYTMLNEAFSGIDKETMTTIANAIAGSTFDEKKLIDAVIEAKSGAASEDSDLKVVK